MIAYNAYQVRIDPVLTRRPTANRGRSELTRRSRPCVTAGDLQHLVLLRLREGGHGHGLREQAQGVGQPSRYHHKQFCFGVLRLASLLQQVLGVLRYDFHGFEKEGRSAELSPRVSPPHDRLGLVDRLQGESRPSFAFPHKITHRGARARTFPRLTPLTSHATTASFPPSVRPGVLRGR